MGLSIAKFPFVRTLEDFEFDAQPSVERRQLIELATARWVAHGGTLLLLGPHRVGKTHLAVALGREAIIMNGFPAEMEFPQNRGRLIVSEDHLHTGLLNSVSTETGKVQGIPTVLTLVQRSSLPEQPFQKHPQTVRVRWHKRTPFTDDCSLP